ncbi:type II toxin-antitoxin system HicA family toxin [Hymenobacter psoromatis]|uniref:type II toxin-antitoxin system HicA family toxin n=1 Tax=Hymenobacter psoromatis TaxID=1484116 RepID=UPI001CBDB511|nr:type II toxin-antitoxin system HicA family toxin [Hymenobacter psoromatis]
MSRKQKFLDQLLSGQHDHTIDFAALCTLLISLGFEQRIRGSHHILGRIGVVEIINLQPGSNGAAKPYQVKQVRSLLLTYQDLLNLSIG